MHEKALEKINGKLIQVLNSCEIENSWPVFDSYNDIVYEIAVEALKHKKDFLSVSSIYSIFANFVKNAISHNYPKKSDTKGLLSELLGKEKITDIAASISSFIASIPREFLVYFPLPGFQKLEKEVVELAEGLSINFYKNQDTIPGGCKLNILATMLESAKLNLETNYVCIAEKGYAGGNIQDSAFQKSMSKLKQFVHLGFVRRFFTKRPQTRSGLCISGVGYYSPTLHSVVFDRVDPQVVCCSVVMPRSISNYIDRVTLNTENKYYKEMAEKGELVRYVKGIFSDPAKLIAITDDNNYATPIKTALEWAFEAAVNENETISFLQTCIGLEAILGEDSDRESLTETLSDRCAYLIGTNIKKRKIIKTNFKELYRLRSKLVHGRSLRLDENERGYLRWGKNVLDAVISKELNNLNLNST